MSLLLHRRLLARLETLPLIYDFRVRNNQLFKLDPPSQRYHHH